MRGERAIETRCCIAGGGPAGMMLGFLLARAGVDVIVLEKHADFLRDFRGDTIHPSTLAVMDELGLLEAFLQRPHEETSELGASIGGESFRVADFRHVPGRCKFIAFMPQWDFLNFIAGEASRYPAFRLEMRAEVRDVVRGGGRVVGIVAETPNGPLMVRAPLVVAADGRASVVRDCARLLVRDIGAPMDVLWFRVSRRPVAPPQYFGDIDRGTLLVLIARDAYYQAGLLIRKGDFDGIRARGLEEFRERILARVPFLGERVEEVREWDQVRLLTVKVDRVERWYAPGLLCIGDAAHAMSPVGGVGINLAIQDAVATANLLAEPLRRGGVAEGDLRAVQRRREPPTKLTQLLQGLIQKRIIERALGNERPISAPFAVRALNAIPLLRRIPARIIGVGFRPEHVRPSTSSG